ncbi:DUF3034 family protein [Massilia arenosa]|uniref:DUF3034 family protein n=1 Tax=Zemynaea arenosa TaxID=2561931 RepID=A0A4Y9S1N6_9BURK|nr:DUF3034 family protein [Massilia arenosa]TFW15407.1 DUF3034 family protein [Massilia arenosa]
MRRALLAGAALLCGSAHAAAGPNAPDMGKLLATGGVAQLEGAGGGGLTPWALITGYGSGASWGANAHATTVRTQDYALHTYGIAVGITDRVELSFARQEFSGSLAPLDHLKIKQDIAGVKLRVLGDAVYEQDSGLPQIAVGALVKKNKGVGGLGALGVTSVTQLGARDDGGIDFYVAATKIDLAHSLLWNGTVRFTKANQMGLLGFGGDRGNRLKPQFEASLAWLINRKWVAGVEYRMKPRNLGVDNEKDAYDAFVAWFPNKNLSLTAAYAVLGDITVFNPTNQRGLYLSAQAGF